jgi:hypothetical protein
MKMEKRNTTRRALLGHLLSVSDERGFSIAGNQDRGWILINHVKLGPEFNRPESSVNIRFSEGRGDPNVAVFASVELRSDSHVCPHFLQQAGPADAWRGLCPHIFQDVDDDVLEFITCLVGLLAEPRLCGLLGCEWKEGARDNPGALHNSGDYFSSGVSDMPVME